MSNTDSQLPISSAEALFEYAAKLDVTEIHSKIDNTQELQAIVAIHNTHRGPAIGGCRCIEYTSLTEAMCDAIRLANGMAYKAAVCGLPHGGAKSVILKPKVIKNREAFFATFGQFVNELNGRYIAAVDSGTTSKDMDSIGRQTKHVVCATLPNGEDGNPSPYTATGVRLSIEAAVKFLLGKNDLSGLRVAIQGVGNVGHFLAQQLHERGAQLIVTDTNAAAVEYCVEHFNAKAVSLGDIYSVDCDIFSPCALGASINEKTIPQLKTKIIAGCANNQLKHPEDGERLRNLGILYAPDYVANGGGLIYASSLHTNKTANDVEKGIAAIYNSLIEIFQRAEKNGKTTNTVADELAREIIATTAPKPLD